MLSQYLLKDIKQTGCFAAPLVGARILHAINGFVNMMLIAQLGATATAAGALIFSTATVILLIAWSLFYSMAVIIGKAYGAGNKCEIGSIVSAGLLLSLIFGGLFSFALWHIDQLLLLLQQPRELVVLATPYFHALSFGIIPSLWGICFNEFVMGIGRSRLVIIWAGMSTPLNIVLSYSLLFGKFGLPNLGIAGAAVATAVTYWGLFCCVGIYFYSNNDEYGVFKLFSFEKNKAMQYAKKILRIGWPISFQLGAIGASYSLLTYMMGWLGKPALAAHHIANQWVSLIIMVPYGIAQASSVLVAQAIGSKRKLAESIGYAGVIIGCGIVMVVSLLYWVFPNFLIGVYLNLHDLLNINIVHLAAALLALMGIVQLADTVGVITTGALRGFHDTTIPMLIGTGMNWLVSIPLGYYIAFVMNLGAVGLYVGFIIGSCCSALLLWCRFLFLCRLS